MLSDRLERILDPAARQGPGSAKPIWTRRSAISAPPCSKPMSSCRVARRFLRRYPPCGSAPRSCRGASRRASRSSRRSTRNWSPSWAGRSLKISYASRPPTVVLLAGLQGSGKTTASAKLARGGNSKVAIPSLIGADLQRPAAVEQLRSSVPRPE